MKYLLKYTYLLDVEKIKKRIEIIWGRYQTILNNENSSFKDLNEARAILYFLGCLYPEKIALESLEKRIKHIKPPITLDEFFLAIDTKDKKILNRYKKDNKFNKLKDFYLIVKDIKNRVKNNTYLDEGRFNKIFSKLKPKDYF
ncbi:MAG: hypothetical protein PHI88_02585 [Candidatus Pacebacteria bacterium]|nr:hypothetical protein [Candidatus Paceibacterota bacterium]